jgi:hypothetical protein
MLPSGNTTYWNYIPSRRGKSNYTKPEQATEIELCIKMEMKRQYFILEERNKLSQYTSLYRMEIPKRCGFLSLNLMEPIIIIGS